MNNNDGTSAMRQPLAVTIYNQHAMPRFTEDQLNSFRLPPSDTEEQKLANAERQIRDAIGKSEKLKSKSYKIFGQGSYANDTNVRINSDVDINVRLDDTVFVHLPPNKTYEDYGYNDTTYHYSEFRNDVLNALIAHFGNNSIEDNNKCITVLPNTYRVEIDVVPTCKYIRYDSETSKVEGIKFFTKSYTPIINFPLQHIENGKSKNTRTQKRFKRLTRIYRRIRYKMKDDNVTISDNITSYLLECLVWNVPDSIFNNYSTWTDRLKQSIIYLYNNTDDEEKCKDWGDVSDLLYLFRESHKWTVKDVNTYLIQMWQYLQF